MNLRVYLFPIDFIYLKVVNSVAKKMHQTFHVVVIQVSLDISTQNKLNAFDIWYQMFWPVRVVKEQHYLMLHKIEVFIIMTLRGYNEY